MARSHSTLAVYVGNSNTFGVGRKSGMSPFGLCPAHLDRSDALAATNGALPHRTVGSIYMRVNASHHQTVRPPGPHAVANAIAPDTIIEGLEDSRHRCCLGVDPGDRHIFDALIEASRQ